MPVVRLPRSGLPGWAIAVAVVLVGLLLFAVLDARRRTPSAPAVRGEGVASPRADPPPLVIRDATPPVVAVAPAPAQQAPSPPPAEPRIVYVPQPYPVPAPTPVTDTQVPAAPPPASNAPVLVFDAGAPAAGPAAASPAEASGAAPAAGPEGFASGSRARAGMFANRATTVAQGTLIPAVLETGLDSTRPGMARAIVSRDVRGFDGSRVLIPRGSRLIGEYRSEASPGQNRALVNWTRLIRPDGATIAIGSPAADPQGRTGIRARVNTHFFERFAGAILQSALDIGVNLAARSAGGTIVVLPGAGQQAITSQVIQPSQITPTLKVRPGTSISIFVARDLDFTGVESRE